MEVKKQKIGAQKTNYFLHCDYGHLCNLVSSATVEVPAVANVLLERDLSYLMRHVKPGGDNSHMDASVRMACAFLELRDPFPDYVGKRAV